ncbi:hypothetical protein [Agrobacterium sp. NPDC089420]|uniref:hypothetical protein n=1 Tax=Agrobacterium sp. NPDC089420 TaxID=3363918 RepID=UPI00384AD0F6
MPNRSNMRRGRVSSQLLAVRCVSADGVLSRVESAEGEAPPPVHNDRLYVVGETDPAAIFAPRPMPDRAGDEAACGTEIRNTVVDADIRVAKWGWAVLAIAHCWLIYFMVQNLG